MSEKNYKNFVQEYCQSHKIPVPIYFSWNEGSPHAPRWKSVATISTPPYKIYSGGFFSKKVESEISCAQNVYDYIMSNDKYVINPSDISVKSPIMESFNLFMNSDSSKSQPKQTTHITPDAFLISESNENTICIEADKVDVAPNPTPKPVPKPAPKPTPKSHATRSTPIAYSPSTPTQKPYATRSAPIIYPPRTPPLLLDPMELDKFNPKSLAHKNQSDSPVLSYFDKIVLIDLENSPSSSYLPPPNVIVIGFHTSIHHSIGLYKLWTRCESFDLKDEVMRMKNEPVRLLYLISGGINDLVDHYMTSYSYPVVSFIKEVEFKGEVIIVSRDHAAFCTEKCISIMMKSFNINVPIRNIGKTSEI